MSKTATKKTSAKVIEKPARSGGKTAAARSADKTSSMPAASTLKPAKSKARAKA